MKSTNSSSDNTMEVPIWRKYVLTTKETCEYFNIGRDKLRQLAIENPDASWVLMDGSHIRIKRILFEKMIDEISSI